MARWIDAAAAVSRRRDRAYLVTVPRLEAAPRA
jgi:hypothetical protein